MTIAAIILWVGLLASSIQHFVNQKRARFADEHSSHSNVILMQTAVMLLVDAATVRVDCRFLNLWAGPFFAKCK